ncbi:hypothetical protein CAPTEDRAFT_101801 [Capitella teleta]|uniref:D-aminoacyl-tRNA deacylase n=1 Tax=Capitella teleta TaxID=283909 RepID=R7UIX7_CAPTE|nr:hypothetical protein CAPTEDRAFT_101801 [Capitella teleta]|eukprot:ELU03758.1 hypothetical protein CAPTEDRAFT_101801 [Capitella teleta]
MRINSHKLDYFSVGDELVSSVGRGICVLVGISRDDTPTDMEFMVRKILNLRLFDDENGKRWNKSVMDKDLEVLCVSQFTLYSILKGNKPDFHLSMGGEDSEIFYKEFYKQMQKTYKPDKIKDGVFGAMMQVNIQNDGPVTITLESPQNNASFCFRSFNFEERNRIIILYKKNCGIIMSF